MSVNKFLKTVGACTSTIAVSAALSLTVASQVQAQTIIKFSHFLPSTSGFQRLVAQPWCNAIEKDSGGKLKCQIYPSLALGGTPAQLVDQVKNGVADIVWTSPSYATGRFPRSEALELPFVIPPDGLMGSRAMWEFTQKYAMEDYKDFKLLAMHSGGNGVFHTAKTPILSSSDLKGLKIRAPSRFISMFLKELGAIPVNMPLAQTSEGITKGVMDGAVIPWEVLTTIKVEEVVSYSMESSPDQPGFTQTPMAILMNKAKYESLAPELRAIIDKHSGGVLVDQLGKAWDEGIADSRKKVVARGNKILILKKEDMTAMRKAAEVVETDWVASINAKGLNGKQLAEGMHSVGAKYLNK